MDKIQSFLFFFGQEKKIHPNKFKQIDVKQFIKNCF